MQVADFIVVGAGMAGASIAAELAGHGRVVLVERETQPGYHATGRSAALFAESYGGPEIRALTRASRAFLEKADLTGFVEAPLLSDRGCLFIARQDQIASLDRLEHELGGATRRLTGREIKGIISAIREDVIVEGLIDDGAMDIDVHNMLHGYLRLFRARGGATLLDVQSPSVEFAQGSWTLKTSEAAVTAPILINAAGAWADEFAELCGLSALGLTPLRRTAVLVDPPAGAIIDHWPCTIDVDEEFYFKPDAGKLFLSPADETPTPPSDVQPEDLDVAIAVDRVQGALELEVRRVNHRWAGLRTFSTDRVPIVGFDPRADGFFWFAGQGGYGIQTAPAMARLGTALASGRPAPIDIVAEGLNPARLDPQRFLPVHRPAFAHK